MQPFVSVYFHIALFWRFIHAIACVSNLFLFIGKQYPTVWTNSLIIFCILPQFLVQGVLSSPCTFPATALESAISPRNFGYFQWGRLFRNQELSGYVTLSVTGEPLPLPGPFAIYMCTYKYVSINRHRHMYLHIHKHERLSYF